MNISKTIEQMDLEFATEAGLTLDQFRALDLMQQSKIKRRITNKKLKNQRK